MLEHPVSPRLVLRRLEDNDLDALRSFMGGGVITPGNTPLRARMFVPGLGRMRNFPNREHWYRALCLREQEDIGQAGILPKTIFGKDNS